MEMGIRMELYIGGYAQGKLKFVLETRNKSRFIVIDGQSGDALGEDFSGEATAKEQQIIWNHFHLWVREGMKKGMEIEKEAEAFLSKHPDCIIISEEVGNGIVPLDAFEREYRERLGRLLIRLAARAERVERILCGLGQRLK